MRVIVWQNDNVMVFGEDGRQVAALQGPLWAVRERLALAVPPGEWRYRVYPGSKPRQASPAWLAGRAREIARAQRLSLAAGWRHAEYEDGTGATHFAPREV